jgi:hypothetical protein
LNLLLFLGIASAVGVGAAGPSKVFAQLSALRDSAGSDGYGGGFCGEYPWLCTDVLKPYVGHDEPSMLFYSATPGAGNSATYTLKLPTDPPTRPNQSGTAGTYNFQLHPAFWFGMAMCDTQSAPEFTHTCKPDSDANIFEGTNPALPNYIGHHPGGAYMEMQFYPPGWLISCDPKRWCAALTIALYDQNRNIDNNTDCLNRVGSEPVNFAYITKSGVATNPADPLNPNQPVNFTQDLFMNSGDVLTVQMNDTTAGFKVVIKDLTTGQQGSMTASTANGFKQVVFNPSATTCSSVPYAFHPMYATSSERTSLTWPTHSSNAAASDEIGHFEYCSNVASDGTCLAGISDPGGPDNDDSPCGIDASPDVPIGGCIGTDVDFDGVPYKLVWPGTNSNAAQDHSLHPSPIIFSSPVFASGGVFHPYSRVGFETDLPAIEGGCDIHTGAGCTHTPAGAAFYPTHSNAVLNNRCVWQLGGLHIPGTTNTRGGSAQWGPLLSRTFPVVGGAASALVDFRQVLSSNPCP